MRSSTKFTSAPVLLACRRSLIAFLSTAALSLFVPSIALAYDEVSLRDGGIFKGEILVLQPGEKVVIQIPGEKTPRTIPWSLINDVVRDKGDEAPESPNRDPQSVPGDNDWKPGLVQVRVNSDGEQATLMAILSTQFAVVDGKKVLATRYMPVCDAPCSDVVDASDGAEFYITSDDMPQSSRFTLDNYGENATVDVNPGSFAAKYWGFGMTTVGAVGLLGGAGLLAAGAADEPDLVAAGAVTLGIGAGLVIGGIVTIIESGTDVTVSPHSASAGRYEARSPRYWLGEF